MAILCCTREEEDDLKSGVSDVPPKKTKITPTPTRTARPGDQPDPVDIDKEAEAKAPLNEKSTGLPASNEAKLPMSEKVPMSDAHGQETRDEKTALSPMKTDPLSPGVISGQPSYSVTPVAGVPVTAHDQVTSPGTNENAIPRVDQEDAHIPIDTARDSDVEMSDAPPVVPDPPTVHAAEQPRNDRYIAAPETPPIVVDEPVQPAEVQPEVPLPPPPPLAKRKEQVMQNDVTAVADVEPERQQWLLPAVLPQHKGRKCLILDLDETLVHSSFKILNQADMTIPVEIEGQYHNVYVIKRPGVDQFMKRVGELYEVVVFTASVSKYGDPLLDQLDIHGVVHHRLFRESCYNHQGNYVKVCTDFSPVRWPIVNCLIRIFHRSDVISKKQSL